MKWLFKYVVLILTIILWANTSQSQNRQRQKSLDHRFEITFISGVNLSQIDGDFFTGFDLVGLNAGLQVEALIIPRIALTVGMMYSQKGAKTPHGTIVSVQSSNDRTLRLNYIEIPILFKSMLDHRDSGPFIEIGGSIGRLSSTKIIEKKTTQRGGTIYSMVVSEFKNSEINAVAGLGFTIGKRFAFSFRYIYGFTKFYNDPDFFPGTAFSTITKEVEFLRNYNIAFLLSYRIL